MRILFLSFINKDIISLILTVFFSLIILFSNDSKYVKNIEKQAVDLISFIASPKKWYKEILIVKDDNLLLTKKVTQLQLLISTYENHKIENDKLRDMLGFKNSYEKLTLKPANIVNHNFSSSIYSVIADVGEDDLIEKNMPVIDMNGLFGKTISIGSNATKIQTITDKNFAVSVKVGKDNVLAIFKPTHGRFGVLEGVIKSAQINIGDKVYTSGISEIYPSNLPVANVINLKREKNKPFQDVSVEILADFKNLNYVFIIQ